MKLKYFLRGLGAGIIFASVIFLTAYLSHPIDQMTDEEIIEQAKELGMVEKDDHLKDLITSEQTTEKKDKVDISKDESKDSTTDNDEHQEKTTEEKTTEEKTTEATTVKVTTETTTEVSTESKTEEVTISVQSGATSYTVAQKIQDAGLIENAYELDSYLVKNGYANRIRTGNYILKKGMTFEEIAKIITKS